MWGTVCCGEWWKASVKLLCIIIGPGRSMLRPQSLTLATHLLCVPAHASVRGRVYTILSTCPVPLLCVQFKVSFPPSPTTSLSPHFSKFMGVALPRPMNIPHLPHLPSASKKGGVAFLTANYAHNKSIEQSHYLSVRASTDGRASCLAHGCVLTA